MGGLGKMAFLYKTSDEGDDMTNTTTSIESRENKLAEMIYYMAGIVIRTPPEPWELIPPYRQNLFIDLARKAFELEEMT